MTEGECKDVMLKLRNTPLPAQEPPNSKTYQYKRAIQHPGCATTDVGVPYNILKTVWKHQGISNRYTKHWIKIKQTLARSPQGHLAL